MRGNNVTAGSAASRTCLRGSLVAWIGTDMELWLSEERAGHPNEVSDALGSLRPAARRHVSWLFYALAVVGVPAAVFALTGGSEAVGFWIVTTVWLTGVAYGAILAVFVALLALSPVLLVVGRLIGGDTDAWASRVSRVAVLALTIGIFLVAAPLGDGADVKLPVPWPNLGAVIVMAAGVATSYLLWTTGRRLKPSKRPKPPVRRHSVPEPEEEYWSDQYVVGWRSWNWDGSSLRGVYARWASGEFEASCPHCDIVPSWDHVCGVYAAKQPGDVYIFYGWSPIVGRVEMWGNVIEHENGYRASHARITDLWVHDPHRAARIRDAYPSVNVIEGSPSVRREVV
jgi:hypothetical protein